MGPELAQHPLRPPRAAVGHLLVRNRRHRTVETDAQHVVVGERCVGRTVGQPRAEAADAREDRFAGPGCLPTSRGRARSASAVVRSISSGAIAFGTDTRSGLAPRALPRTPSGRRDLRRERCAADRDRGRHDHGPRHGHHRGRRSVGPGAGRDGDGGRGRNRRHLERGPVRRRLPGAVALGDGVLRRRRHRRPRGDGRSRRLQPATA